MMSNTNTHFANLSSPMHQANSVTQSLYTLRKYLERPARKYEAVVMENREHSDGNYIRVLPTEILPFTKGHLRNNPVPLKETFLDARGRSCTVRATHNNNITAEWLSTDSYRKTPPDVQRGERVYIWQKADSDVWYWDAINHDSMLRRHLETVVQSVNGDLQTAPDSKKHDSDNSYYQEMSSHNGTYTVSTSQKNGEFARYLFQINAKDGSMVLKDDIGNHIELDSSKTRIWLRNACQTEITCVKNDINVHCNDFYTEDVGKDQTVTIGKDLNITIDNNRTTQVKNDDHETIDGNSDKLVRADSKDTVNGNRTDVTDGNYTAEIKGTSTITNDSNVTLTIKGNYNIDVKGETTITCPVIKLKGNTTIEGDFNVTGSTNLAGGGTVGGDMAIQGGLGVQGQVALSGGTTTAPINEV